MKVDLAIIGAGLSALRQVRGHTDDYAIIDRGPLGTTCARTGCMPSKALIHIANEFHRRQGFPGEGLPGAGKIACDLPSVMQHVRGIRDKFAGGMVDKTRELAGDHLIEGEARFLSPTVLEVGGQRIEAGHTIIANLPVFMAGDVNGNRPILHEAIDEGFLAGHNALQQGNACAARRVPLAIVFSDPEGMVVGKHYAELEDARIVVGKVGYADQSRAVIEGRNRGLLHLYAEPATGRLLGAEAAAPGAADLGHLLAFAIQQEATVFDLLQMPFYHPTVTEALRTALRDAAEQCRGKAPKGVPLFDSQPERPLRGKEPCHAENGYCEPQRPAGNHGGRQTPQGGL